MDKEEDLNLFPANLSVMRDLLLLLLLSKGWAKPSHQQLKQPVLITVTMIVLWSSSSLVICVMLCQHFKSLKCNSRGIQIMLIRTIILHGSNPIIEKAKGLSEFICYTEMWLYQGLLEIIPSLRRLIQKYGSSTLHLSEVIGTVSRVIEKQSIVLIKQYLKHGIINVKQIGILPLLLVSFQIIIFWGVCCC